MESTAFIRDGAKDVVCGHMHEKVRIVLSFPECSDANTPYIIPLLIFSNMGIKGQFVVI